MWNGKMKALTFSYDDGTAADIRLVKILNEHGMKGTFNLSSGTHKSGVPDPAARSRTDRLTLEELPALYKGHEIASHALTHARMDQVSREECVRQAAVDRDNLEKIFGKRPTGFCYPCGGMNDAVVEVLDELGFYYARTNLSTFDFELPTDYLRFRFTCRHREEPLMALAEKFRALECDRPQFFCVMGHSYEFENEGNWDVIERFCDFMAGRDDIYYGTTEDILREYRESAGTNKI